MKKQTFYCDECGAERKEANHWFLAIPHSEATKQYLGVDLVKWSDEQANVRFSEGLFHLCGQKCVHAALDRFMSSGKLEK